MDQDVVVFARQRYLGRLLILPAAVTVVIAMILPIGYAIVMSFFSYRLGGERSAVFVLFDNYIRFFQDTRALSALGITLVFSVVALAAEIAIGTIVAVALTTIDPRAASVFRTIFVVPMLISPIIVALIWRYMLDPHYGLVYWLLGLVGLADDFGGLSEPGWALLSVILVDVWQNTPFVMLIVTSGLTSISADLYESARVDGAGPVRIFGRITVPLLTGVLIVITVIRGMDAFRVFDIIYGLTNGGPADSTLSLSIYAYKQGFDNYEMGYAITISVLTMLFLVLVFSPLMRQFNKDTRAHLRRPVGKGSR